MFSYDSTNNSLPICNYTNPCSTILSNSNWTTNNSNNGSPSSCYRPLQQLYKTVYSPMYGNNASHVNFACICRPSERYKTTNMTYGSFYYDNQISTQKDRVLNYDRAIFARCYDNKKRMEHQSTGGDRSKGSFSIFNRNDAQENQLWTQTTSDACCPVDCCNRTNNCTNYQTSNPCSSLQMTPSTPNKNSSDHIRCV